MIEFVSASQAPNVILTRITIVDAKPRRTRKLELCHMEPVVWHAVVPYTHTQISTHTLHPLLHPHTAPPPTSTTCSHGFRHAADRDAGGRLKPREDAGDSCA